MRLGLTSWTLVGLCAALVLLAPLAALVLWSRVPGGRALRIAQRLAMIVTCQVTAIMLAAVLLNRDFYFYSSWSDLFGSHEAGPVQVESPRQISARVDARFSHAGARVRGVTLSSTVVGPRSRIKARLIVYLPPQYSDPAYARTRFPVVELFPGYPGQPQTWLHKLHVADALLAEVRAGRAKPFVLVLPAMNVDGMRDTECSNVVGGRAVETWLTDDVRQLVTRGYRVRTDAAGWAAMGYSTGGFCATKLAMRRPDLFGAAVSMSGYFTVSHDANTGDLFGGNRRLEQENSPSWLVSHRPPPPVQLLLTATAQDGATVEEVHAFATAARPPLRVSEMIDRRGGHNTGVWAAQVPACLDWLSRRVTARQL